MKNATLLAFTTAALLAAGSAFACPRKDKEQSPGDEGVYEVVQRDGDKKTEEGDRPKRPERGERPERGDRGDRRGPGEGPLKALGLSEDQQTQVKEIMEGAREAAMAVREQAKKAHDAGEEVDREAIMKQMREIHEGAMKKVYDDVLNDEQRAKLDKMREEMEKRRAEHKKDGDEGDRPRRRPGGEEGDRPRRGGDKEGDRPKRGGDDLDL